MRRPSSVELLLFVGCFLAFGYFNQGGGWNQNARFAEVRALVEQGRCAIDDYLVYRRDPQTDDLVRLPVRAAEYEVDGKRFALSWVDMEWTFFPVNERGSSPDAEKVAMVEVCTSGDIGYVPATGHFHPNKPPGTSFFAVPAYWVIYHVERALGISPDGWWALTVNAWLTTAFSVGLMSAVGCVFFYRLAREFSGGAELPALLATLALAFGTTFFPFGTILFDHNLTASLLVMAFYFLRCRESRPASALAGLCAGLAAITNYVAAIAVVFLGLYLLLRNGRLAAPRSWELRRSLAYSAGVLPPFLLICWYHWANFGSPFALSTDFQNPLFKDPNGALGMFRMPSSYVGGLLLVSPYRGIFFLAPILVLGLGGILVWLYEKTFVAEARLCLAIAAFFFLVNMSFNGYHGGFSAGPRYLIPGLPFLALPLVIAFQRWRLVAFPLLAVSVVQQSLLTVTDAQNPLAVGGHARLDDEHRKDDFYCSVVWEYAWPLFATGRVGPLLEELLEAKLDLEAHRLAGSVEQEDERDQQLAASRAEWRASIEEGAVEPFLLAAIQGPVSVNPMGVYDGLLGFGKFAMNAPQSTWSSCNLGELLWPQTRVSLLPLLALSGGLLGAAIAQTARSRRREDIDPVKTPEN